MRLHDFALLFALAPFVTGCGKSDVPAKPATPAPPAHDHKAPHGGVILELGDAQGHVEVVHEPKTGSVVVYVYGKNLQTPVAVETPTLLVMGKSGAEEVKPTAVGANADGISSQWTAIDARLMAEPLVGRIRVKIAGTTHQSSLEPADIDHTGHNHN